MEMFGSNDAKRNTDFTARVNSILNLCRTNAVIVPVTMVPKQDTTIIIAVLTSPSITRPSRNAILKFSNCGVFGNAKTFVVRYSSLVFSEPISTTSNGRITIRQHTVRNTYLRIDRKSAVLFELSSLLYLFKSTFELSIRYFLSLKTAF